MKRLLLLGFCALSLSAATPNASASNDVRIWHRHHKDKDKSAEKTAAAPKPKSKKSIFHRGKPSQEQAAKSEATYGMTGPKSVGGRHPQPGPAGYGAK